jgi:hypothetical protein
MLGLRPVLPSSEHTKVVVDSRPHFLGQVSDFSICRREFAQRTCHECLANPRHPMQHKYQALAHALNHIVKRSVASQVILDEGVNDLLLSRRQQQYIKGLKIELDWRYEFDGKEAPALIHQREARDSIVADQKTIARQCSNFVTWRQCRRQSLQDDPNRRFHDPEHFAIHDDAAFDLRKSE